MIQYVVLNKWAYNGPGLRKYKVIQVDPKSLPAPLAGKPERLHIFGGEWALCDLCYGDPDAPQHYLPLEDQAAYERIIASQCSDLLERQDHQRFLKNLEFTLS